MDIATLMPSRIVAVARAAYARPDTEFLCFGESDQPGPAGAIAAATAALARGDALYSDVRGVLALRHALADMLTRLHARPVAEDRIQVTASGMTAVSVALAAVVRAGDRVVLHTPAWPNPANATLLRGAGLDAIPPTPPCCAAPAWTRCRSTHCPMGGSAWTWTAWRPSCPEPARWC